MGRVTDSTNQVLVAATVVVLSSADSSLISFAITSEDGSFYLPEILPGLYELQITYLGYGSFAKGFEIAKGTKEFDFGNLALEKNSELLQEVVVKAEHVPVSISNDTVLYNAAAFKVRTNDAVEDLLRKLPGIEVSPTGEIKAQGETVNKVLVDGKEFFGNDHKIATRNLPANIVDKVAVFDKKSEESVFTGIQDGQDEKTIDLRLKSDKKVGLFGKLAAGLGAPDRYTAKAQVNSFTSKMQLSFIGNANNVNEISFDSDKNQMGLGNAVVVVSSGETDEEEFVNGKNTTLSSGLNFNYDFSNKSRLRSSYFFKNLKNDVFENTKTNYYNTDVSFLNNERLDSKLKNLGHNVNSALEIDADSSFQFRLINRLNLGDQNNFFRANANNFKFDGSVFASSDRRTHNKVGDFGYEGNAILRKRLGKKGRLWSLNLGYNLDNQRKGDTLDNTIIDGSQPFSINQQQEYLSNNYNLGGGFTYTEPMSHDFYLSSYLRLNQDKEHISKDFFDISMGQPQNLSLLSGTAGLSILSWRAGTNLTKQTEDYSYQFGISAIQLNLAFKDQETSENSRRFLFI
ncbi:MAG TPA: carboxypeptidase regulatory-like domain-containing protein, partial [Saprospiraceae bacterium]|nr:carboxypeptidase regulatory-like domain-containing protein [Saprospiraceae bacterium]